MIVLIFASILKIFRLLQFFALDEYAGGGLFLYMSATPRQSLSPVSYVFSNTSNLSVDFWGLDALRVRIGRVNRSPDTAAPLFCAQARHIDFFVKLSYAASV